MPYHMPRRAFVHLSSLCGASFSVLIFALANFPATPQTGGKNRQRPLTEPASANRVLTPREIAARSLPSVVLITMTDTQGRFRCTGSGFVVRRDLVATNKHVTDCGARGRIKVAGDERERLITSVTVDADHDLALVGVDGIAAPALPIAVDDELSIGDDVFVAGNPEGYEGTFSRGIISALRARGNLIQIDAAISKGSSGGPVIDVRGRVVGVAVAKNNRGQNLNFPVPAVHVSRLITKVERAEALGSPRSGRQARDHPADVSPAPRDGSHNTAARWVVAVGKQTDFTVEFPGEPRYFFEAPGVFSNMSVERYGRCTDAVCLLAAVLWSANSNRETNSNDGITDEEQKHDAFARELAGWKVTRTTRLSASAYEVEGAAPATRNGASSFIMQRVVKHEGRTYKLDCQAAPGGGEPDRRTCERFFTSLRFGKAR